MSEIQVLFLTLPARRRSRRLVQTVPNVSTFFDIEMLTLYK